MALQTASSIFTGRPARSGVVFTQLSKNRFFRPIGATRSPINVVFEISRLSGQKCGNTAPKNVKISNFGHNFGLRNHSFAQFLQNSQILYASTGSFCVFNVVTSG